VNKEADGSHTQEPQTHPYRVRLPGFLIEEETGLGDVVKRVTYAMGIHRRHLRLTNGARSANARECNR
jgi:hypothetical protein